MNYSSIYHLHPHPNLDPNAPTADRTVTANEAGAGVNAVAVVETVGARVVAADKAAAAIDPNGLITITEPRHLANFEAHSLQFIIVCDPYRTCKLQ